MYAAGNAYRTSVVCKNKIEHLQKQFFARSKKYLIKTTFKAKLFIEAIV